MLAGTLPNPSNTVGGQMLVAHTCNPSYQEAEVRRVAVQSQTGQIVHETLSRKTLSQKKKRADRSGVAQGEGSEFKPQNSKTKHNKHTHTTPQKTVSKRSQTLKATHCMILFI
jgi:hypothetical protein